MCVPAQLNRPWSLALWLPDTSLILFVITWDLFASKWDTCSVRLWIWDFKVFISPAFSWTSFVAWRMNVKYLLLLSTTSLSYLEMIHQITLLYGNKKLKCSYTSLHFSLVLLYFSSFCLICFSNSFNCKQKKNIIWNYLHVHVHIITVQIYHFLWG